MCKKPSPEEIFGPKLTEEEVMRMIQKTPGLYSKYLELSETLKSEFLEFCMGERGLNLTYDPMFKAVFNPQQYAYRLDEFLSLCLGEEVKILHALPTESSRLTDEGSPVGHGFAGTAGIRSFSRHRNTKSGIFVPRPAVRLLLQ